MDTSNVGATPPVPGQPPTAAQQPPAAAGQPQGRYCATCGSQLAPGAAVCG